MDKVLIGILAVRDAEKLRARMAHDGITVALVYNHSTCTTGCSPSQEVWAHPDDVNTIVATMTADRERELKELGADPELLGRVFDPTQSTAVCPACGTEFSTKASECPDCGLGFSLPADLTS